MCDFIYVGCMHVSAVADRPEKEGFQFLRVGLIDSCGWELNWGLPQGQYVLLFF